jgi:hypothetical protein
MQQSLVRTAIWAVTLVCAALILANGGAVAQRVMIPPEEPAPPTADSDSVPVAVTNFPTVDIRGFPHVVTVEGTVEVGNFPATQNVAGTVDVGNLPFDADGNLRVSAAHFVDSPSLRVVGFTESTPLVVSGRSLLLLDVSNLCNVAFSHSRLCEFEDVFRSTPVPSNLPQFVWVSKLSGTQFTLGCAYHNASFQQVASNDPNCNRMTTSLPVACCGY